MYAIGVNNFGQLGCVVPCGNNGMQTLRNKTVRGWVNETEQMRRVNDAVYVVSSFTQKMCEMSGRQLAEYVIMNNVCRLK